MSFQGGDTHFVIFIAKHVQKQEFSTKSFKNDLYVSRFKGKIPKTQEKNTKLKEKLKIWEDFAPPERPSGAIKKA